MAGATAEKGMMQSQLHALAPAGFADQEQCPGGQMCLLLAQAGGSVGGCGS